MSKTVTEDKAISFLKERINVLGVIWKFFLAKKIKSLIHQRFNEYKAIDLDIIYQLPFHGKSVKYQIDSEFEKAQVIDWYMKQKIKMI